jgi:hypothetical protein
MSDSSVNLGTQFAATSDVLSSGIQSPGHLTADGLMLYMQTRLTGIDEQIEAAFQKQKDIEALRKILGDLNSALSGLDGDEGGERKLDAAKLDAIAAAMYTFNQLDPAGAKKFAQTLRDNGLPVDLTRNYANAGSRTFEPGEIKPLQESVSQVLKELDSSAQLEMIQLQSLMSARQTAISLCTNLVAALGKGEEAIVGNIGR